MRIIVLVLAITASFFLACNNSKSSTEKPKQLVVASDTAKVKYQCPMKCEGDTAYTTEGKCPVCDMDLEKVK